MLRTQNNSDRLFWLLFLYNRYIKINLPSTDTDVAVYGRNSIDIFINNGDDFIFFYKIKQYNLNSSFVKILPCFLIFNRYNVFDVFLLNER